MATKDDAQNPLRLSINLMPDDMAALKAYAARKGVSVTETVKRGLHLLAYVDDVQARGASMNVEENGTLKEVQFMI